jgi:hypothetical protein
MRMWPISTRVNEPKNDDHGVLGSSETSPGHKAHSWSVQRMLLLRFLV